jgi:phosphoribosylformylglycinamidine cyclo-ligase
MDKYKKSGVDVKKADGLAQRLRDRFPGLGGYAGIFETDDGNVLAATCDGVGTKIRLAIDLDMHEIVGEDLVAMSINDIIAGGAKPLFFLDYFSCGVLNEEIFMRVMKGIETGLAKCGCVLLGGETAEMPGMYSGSDYDLAGFAVGSVFADIDKESIEEGDIIIGLPSSGIHSNGYSLVRSIFDDDDMRRYRDLLMKPTEIYSGIVDAHAANCDLISRIKSMAHVTGGGITRALTRLLPEGRGAAVDLPDIPEIFRIIMDKGVKYDEMKGVFNMGVGMMIACSSEDAPGIEDKLGGKRVGQIL